MCLWAVIRFLGLMLGLVLVLGVCGLHWVLLDY